MTKSEFVNWAKARGWVQDKFGHLQKGDYRFKLSSTHARYEKKVRIVDHNGYVLGVDISRICQLHQKES